MSDIEIFQYSGTNCSWTENMGQGVLEEDLLIASGGIRLEPRDSPKRAVA
jgi:hypothetical protein